jgi:DNA-binding FrmR family transcriptional regulator
MRSTYSFPRPLSNTAGGYAILRFMATTTEAAAHGYAPHKEQLLKRLARIEGQVRGISRMIEDDRYCIDILTQLGAVDTALEAVALKVLEEHVAHCVAGALASGDRQEAEQKSRELLEAVQRFAKTR